MFKTFSDSSRPIAAPRALDFLPAAPNRYTPEQVLGVVQDTAESWLEQHREEFQNLAEPNTLAVKINTTLVPDSTIQLLGRAFTSGFPDLGLDVTRAELEKAKIEIIGRPIGEPSGELLSVTGLDFTLNVPTPQNRADFMDRIISKSAGFAACAGANRFVWEKLDEAAAEKHPPCIPVFLCNPFDAKWNALRWTRSELTHSLRISDDASINCDDRPNSKHKISLTIPSLSAILPWELAPGINVQGLAAMTGRPLALIEIGKIDESGKGLHERLEKLAADLTVKMFGPESKFSLVGAMFKSQRSQWQLGIETALIDGSTAVDARVPSINPKRLHT